MLEKLAQRAGCFKAQRGRGGGGNGVQQDEGCNISRAENRQWNVCPYTPSNAFSGSSVTFPSLSNAQSRGIFSPRRLAL